ncbi:MAG: hypothetical protein ACJ8DC_09335 [Gemmatimonadales bacterium]
MSSRVALLLLGLTLAACREHAAETGRTASAYTNGSDTAAGANLGGTTAGVEYEAPRLIPGMQAQMDRLLAPRDSVTDSDLASYKNSAGTLINAMQSDLTRVGLADSGAFKALSDSVLNQLGGGTGVPDRIAGDRLSRNLGQMRRLVRVYQQWMRSAPS